MLNIAAMTDRCGESVGLLDAETMGTWTAITCHGWFMTLSHAHCLRSVLHSAFGHVSPTAMNDIFKNSQVFNIPA